MTDDIFTLREWEFLGKLLENPSFDNHKRIGKMRPKLAAFLARLEVAGALVFEMEVPLTVAPSMNIYSNMETWQKDKLRKALDWHVAAAVSKWRGCILPKGSKRRRMVIVTRRSSARIDENSVDVMGGKVPIDRMVLANVLAGDDAKLLLRRSGWEKAPPGKGSVLVRVYEIAKTAGQQPLLE